MSYKLTDAQMLDFTAVYVFAIATTKSNSKGDAVRVDCSDALGDTTVEWSAEGRGKNTQQAFRAAIHAAAKAHADRLVSAAACLSATTRGSK